MQKNKSRRLRWELALALISTFFLLWFGLVALLQNNRVTELKTALSDSYLEAGTYLRDEAIPYYQQAKAEGVKGVEHSLMFELSNSSINGVRDCLGGAAKAVRLDGTLVRSQLAWGYGGESSLRVEYYLYFDESLTDQGQLDFAVWLYNKTGGWGYAMDLDNKDSTISHVEPAKVLTARVSGVKIDDMAIQVQTIDLIHSDGTAARIFTADIPADCDITVELGDMRLFTTLAPAWRVGHQRLNMSQPLNMSRMEKQLSDYRGAQSFIDREIAGENFPVTSTYGQMSHGPAGDDSEVDGCDHYWIALNCNTRLAASREQWGVYLSTFFLAAALLLTLSTHLSQQVTRPLEALSRDVEKGRCQENGTITELNTLAAAFNGAQDKLVQQLERERSFTRAAAHELKTPLAVLRAHAEALQEDIDPAKREEYLSVVLDEADRMAALTGDLLDLSRLEGGAVLAREPVELSTLVREVFDRFALPMAQKGMSVTVETAPARVTGDRERLQEAVGALASNVLRYCPDGGDARVSLTAENGVAALTVYNEGAPIPEADLPHLWEPFYRADKSRSRECGGTGLGLAIVRAAVAAHGGVCTAENVSGGVAFHITLPLAEEKQ